MAGILYRCNHNSLMRRNMVLVCKLGSFLVVFGLFISFFKGIYGTDGKAKYSEEANTKQDAVKVCRQENTDDNEPCIEVVDAKLEAMEKVDEMTQKAERSVVHISVVCCGDRLPETMTMMKSARLLSKASLQFHIFAEDELHQEFRDEFSKWPSDVLDTVKFNIYPISFPSHLNLVEWKKLFKTCASQRLFIPNLLLNEDATIYVDTDVLFFRPPEDVWDHFKNFNSSQLAALAPEHEDKRLSWYGRFARHPYYPPLGVNSGVMLMNLTMMRNVDWMKHMIDYHAEYKLKITWGDQDLINIYFHYHPEKLYIYNCKWNYRPDHCMHGTQCKTADREGISVLHGCRSTFHNEKQPAFKAVYQAFRDYDFEEDVEEFLLKKLESNYKNIENPGLCARYPDTFFAELRKHKNNLLESKK